MTKSSGFRSVNVVLFQYTTTGVSLPSQLDKSNEAPMVTQDDGEKQRRPVNISAVLPGKSAVVTAHLAPFQVQTNWTPSSWLASTTALQVPSTLVTALAGLAVPAIPAVAGAAATPPGAALAGVLTDYAAGRCPP
jgi:hypothetical protein